MVTRGSERVNNIFRENQGQISGAFQAASKLTDRSGFPYYRERLHSAKT